MEMATIKCNGYSIPGNFELALGPIIQNEINRQRESFLDLNKSEFGQAGKYFNGYRFRDNHTIGRRIESACPNLQHFEENHSAWINAALDDCAQADHWYEFEKDWGNSDQENNSDE